VKNVIVTLGENGSLLVNEKETFHAPIEEKVKVVDTTGAGISQILSLSLSLSLSRTKNFEILM
jgi:sugar/nucleoside kinase (ribokinase family)